MTKGKTDSNRDQADTRSPSSFVSNWKRPPKAEFVSQLKELFDQIEREETFIEACLQQDLENPASILVYEVWRETPESFMKNQMTREYRKGFEQAIVDLKVERTPSWHVSLAEWKKA